jgi:hypothetical protein
LAEYGRSEQGESDCGDGPQRKSMGREKETQPFSGKGLKRPFFGTVLGMPKNVCAEFLKLGG